MSDQQNIIKTTVELETKKAQQNVKNLGKETSSAFDKSSDSTKNFSKSLDGSKGSMEALDGATGGVLKSFKALAVNPLILTITLLVGAFKLVSEAIGRSESASESFGKIGAKLSSLFNGLIAFITPVVEILGETLVFAIEKPGEAWDSLVDTFESGYNFVKQQIFDRFSGRFKVLSGLFEAGVLQMRIAWNNFTGDSDKAEELTKELDVALEKVNEGVELIKGANQAIVDVVTDAVNGIVELGVEAAAAAALAAAATEALANSERALAVNRIQLEKQQLISLRLAEEERQIRDDTSKSIEERISANTRLGTILEDQAKRELSIAQQNLNFAQLQQAATGSTIANIEAVGDAEIKLLEIRERITGQKSEQLVNETALLEEQRLIVEELALKELETQNKIDQLKIDAIRESGEEKLALELEFLEKKRLQELENVELTELGKREIEERFKLEKENLLLEEEERKAEIAEEKKALAEEAAEEDFQNQLAIDAERADINLALQLSVLQRQKQQELQNAEEIGADKSKIEKKYGQLEVQLKRQVSQNKIALASDTLGSLVTILGEESDAGKAVAIAQTTIDTYSSATSAFNSLSGIPIVGPILGGIAAAAAIAAGIANVKKITSTKKPKLARGGILQGPSHAAGGIDMGSSEAEGGEAVINKRSTAMFAPLLSDINSAGGGIKFSKGLGDLKKATSNSRGSNNIFSGSESNGSARIGLDTSIGSSASRDASNNVVGESSSNIVFSESKYADFQNQVQFKEEKTTI